MYRIFSAIEVFIRQQVAAAVQTHAPRFLSVK